MDIELCLQHKEQDASLTVTFLAMHPSYQHQHTLLDDRGIWMNN